MSNGESRNYQSYRTFHNFSCYGRCIRLPCSGVKGPFYFKNFTTGAQLRKDEKIPPWAPEIEREYRKSVLDGTASEFITKLRSHDNLAEQEGENWNVTQNEAYLYNYCDKLYNTETKMYERVNDLQGRDVLRLFARLTVPESPSSSSKPTSKYFDCPGILMEYIQGFLLTDLSKRAPRDVWQYVCDDAIRIVNVIGDRGIRNEDVKTRNSIVRKDSVTGKFKVFCVVDQDERDWRVKKARLDMI
jgi:hypothetical protein